jgi:uncharacterized repeat protein (TIGR01451 family)
MARLITPIILFMALALSSAAGQGAPTIQAPVLKWQHGGCYPSWCETGWYSSPAVADLDDDGAAEVIGATYTLFVLDGADGHEEWHADPPASGARVWPGVVVADIDGDQDPEIITAHGSGYVRALTHIGATAWLQRLSDREFRSLSVADLEDDGGLEVVVGRALLDRTNVWVLDRNGAIRPGWPRLGDGEGSAAGIYNDNIALGDLDGDGVIEIVAPSDTITLCAYRADGSQLSTHEMYHDHPGHDMDYWCEVPAYVELQYEVQGWGPCYEESTARANFAGGPANIVDVDGDGTREVVAIGNVHDCHTSPYTDLYQTPYILNVDRTRWTVGAYDWTTPPTNTGAPLTEDYGIIENAQSNPVTVDLDGDGNLEILFPSYDGRMHAFWLDKTEHGNWPYGVYNPAEGLYRFASEPAVADLDNDGHAEVIFGSWAQKGTHRTGKLHILDYLGHPIHEIDLPAPYGSADWNGALAAPTLADIDGDPDLEVVLNTAHSGLVAYDLNGTAGARILWGTGRANFQRTGAPLYGTLQSSWMRVNKPLARPGEVVTYTIHLENPGPTLPEARITDTLPSEVSYLGNLWASSGDVSDQDGIIRWWGEVPSGQPVTVTFGATLSPEIEGPYPVANTVSIDDGLGNTWYRRAVVIVNGLGTYLPLVWNQ